MTDIALTLEDLASQINAEHLAAIEHARTAVQHARKAGESLIRAKEQVAHGVWLPWLTEHCSQITDRTAQRYMRLARYCLEHPTEAAEIETGSLTAALDWLAEPRSLPAPNTTAVSDLKDEDCSDESGIPLWVRNFGRGQAEHDENIDRLAARLWADFLTDTSGLPRNEQRRHFTDAMEPASRETLRATLQKFPMACGQITMGKIDGAAVCVLYETRKHPGYWHNLDLRQESVSGRPMRPLGLALRIVNDPALEGAEWTTAPDDGTWSRIMEAA